MTTESRIFASSIKNKGAMKNLKLKSAEQINKERIESMKTVNLYPFTAKPCDVESLKESKAYKLWEKSIEDPKSLTRDEKDWIAREFTSQSFYVIGNGISVRGWRLIFPTAKKYLVQEEGSPRRYYVYYGFDKTSVREATGNKKGEILEYKRQK